VVVLLIVLLVFGAGKLPSTLGDLAKGIKSFKAGLKEEGASLPDAAARQHRI
jgi:sec-independent protein translocase protein TatA